MAEILSAWNAMHEEIDFSSHPLSRKTIAASHFPLESHVRLMEPDGSLDVVALILSARLVFSDSGGLRNEAL